MKQLQAFCTHSQILCKFILNKQDKLVELVQEYALWPSLVLAVFIRWVLTQKFVTHLHWNTLLWPGNTRNTPKIKSQYRFIWQCISLHKG